MSDVLHTFLVEMAGEWVLWPNKLKIYQIREFTAEPSLKGSFFKFSNSDSYVTNTLLQQIDRNFKEFQFVNFYENHNIRTVAFGAAGFL